jgi:hypothetical protein
VRAVLRPALALAGAAAVVLASSAAAAPVSGKTLTFKDPAGDNVSPSAASDITGVTWTTTGTKVGKKFVAKNLVLTLSLAAPPTSDGTTVYAIDANRTGCGNFYVNYMPGANVLDSFNYADCGGDPSDPTGGGTSFDGVPEVKGNNIVWTLPLKSLPGEVKVGSTFTALNAFTDFVDPALSIVGTSSTIGVALYDTASTEAGYTVG